MRFDFKWLTKFPVYNAFGSLIPQFAIVRLLPFKMSVGAFEVTQISDSTERLYCVTLTEIGANSRGFATVDYPVPILYDTGGSAANNQWGPVAGSFLLQPCTTHPSPIPAYRRRSIVQDSSITGQRTDLAFFVRDYCQYNNLNGRRY